MSIGEREVPNKPFRAEVKIRYTRRRPRRRHAGWRGSGPIQFDAPQRDITAGQAAVFYQGDVLVGGGIIQ